MTKNEQIELTKLLLDKFLFEINDRVTQNKIANFVNHYIWCKCNKRISVKVSTTDGNDIIINSGDKLNIEISW